VPASALAAIAALEVIGFGKYQKARGVSVVVFGRKFGHEGVFTAANFDF